MPAHCAALRFVGINAIGAEPEIVKFVGRLQQYAVVVGGHHTETAVGAAVDGDIGIKHPDDALGRNTHFHGHFRGVPSVVGEEHLFAGEPHPDRPAGFTGEMCDDDLVGERIAFSAKSATQVRFYDADAAQRDLQYFGKGAVKVMRHLGRCDDGEAVFIPIGCSRMRFSETVAQAVEFERHLCRHIRLLQSLPLIAEAQFHFLVNVVVEFTGIMDFFRFPGIIQRIVDGQKRPDGPEAYFDEPAGCIGNLFRVGGNGSHNFTGVTHFVHRNGSLIL